MAAYLCGYVSSNPLETLVLTAAPRRQRFGDLGGGAIRRGTAEATFE